MVTGIIIGFAIASALFLATTALQIRKQNLVQQMQDLTLKHSVEKIVFNDRMEDLNKLHEIELDKLRATSDVADKYKNGVNGFYSSKKKQANKDDDDTK